MLIRIDAEVKPAQRVLTDIGLGSISTQVDCQTPQNSRKISPKTQNSANAFLVSDNVKLLDTNMKAKARRLDRIITTISAAFLRCG